MSALDTERLRHWLSANVADFLVGERSALFANDAPLELTAFPGGHSNLTYLLKSGAHTLVLRRPPQGDLAKAAHDMGREARLLTALAGHAGAPRVRGQSSDASIVGAPFFVMDHVPGTIVRRKLPPEFTPTPDGFRALGLATARALAELHRTDWRALGLSELYRGDGYAARQIKGWGSRWDAAQTEPVPAMDELFAALARDVPADGPPSLVHNDFKFDNLVLDPFDPGRIVGVLDWELATIGCPWMDVGTSLGYWAEAADPQVFRAIAVVPTDLPGNLDRAAFLAAYEAARGAEVPRPVYYFAFGLFKIAVIAQQIYRRFVLGQASDPRFALLGKAVLAAAELAARALDRNRVSQLA